jgi:hypothetical protein
MEGDGHCFHCPRQHHVYPGVLRHEDRVSDCGVFTPNWRLSIAILHFPRCSRPPKVLRLQGLSRLQLRPDTAIQRLGGDAAIRRNLAAIQRSGGNSTSTSARRASVAASARICRAICAAACRCRVIQLSKYHVIQSSNCLFARREEPVGCKHAALQPRAPR